MASRMRGALLSIIAFVALSSAAEPKICWLETTHDFGAFDEELGLVTTTFKAVNTGDELLYVLSARANCGCTTPKYTLEGIQPGDTLSLTVSYDAKGRPGRFDKKVYVTTNADKNSVLTIIGTVIGSSNSLKGRYPVDGGKIRLSSSVLPFGEVKKGHTASATLRGYNASNDTLRPVVTDNPKYLSPIVRPEAVPPGEQFVVNIQAVTDGQTLWGLAADSLRVKIDSNDSSSTYIPVSTIMIVNEDFSTLSDSERANAPVASLEKEMVDMGIISRASKSLTVKDKITNKGKNTLYIRRLYSPDRAIKVNASSDKIKSGKSIDISIIVDPSEIPAGEPLNARITLITNDPSAPTQIIRVVGEVK
ncbi:MAG: DUF1573 domain-containing protein [Paramuribaculum sp.]|nr:DUF1573 domain-containing protein [Paramuribaculum sp.]